MDNFALWLENELNAQGWSQADLARATGLHKGSISNVINGRRKPSVNFVLAVARALRVKPEEVYQAAGLLPAKPAPHDDETINELIKLVQRLPEDKQQEVINYTRYLYKLAQEGE